MRKIMHVFLAFAVLTMFSVRSLSAQDMEMPACTDEEITVAATAIDAYNEGITSLSDISSDPNEAVYGAVLVGYDAFSYEFWNTVYPEFPVCSEVQVLAFTFGLAYDELATAASFANIAGWAVAAGETEAADYFTEAASSRVDEITAMMEDMEGLTAEDLVEDALPACTQEEHDANDAIIEAYFSGMDDVITEVQSLAADDIESMVATVVAVDTFANSYWEEIYPELPACAEADYEAFLAGLVVDELVLITSLSLNATLESAAGNTDTATLLVTSAATRFTDLADFLAQIDAILGE